MTTSKKIEIILEHAQNKNKMGELLVYIERNNSYQYNRFADRLVQK